MPQFDRDQMIALLRRLEGPDDKDVLDAAREIARRAKEAGVSWDDLLAPSEGEVERTAPDAGPGDTASAALSPEETADARSEIEALLALDRISKTTRDEIVDLRADLGEGRFGKTDLRYVRALRTRLS